MGASPRLLATINKQESVMVDTRIFTYLPDSDTRILEAVNNQLTASPSDQDYRQAVLEAKNVGIALFVAS